jgi:hypothetical protein
MSGQRRDGGLTHYALFFLVVLSFLEMESAEICIIVVEDEKSVSRVSVDWQRDREYV